jgi:UDP-GlcNAc:undecaprenyl-phosphate/decaprenyl-phosphate GlcNAc-1-phosphate transferase
MSFPLFPMLITSIATFIAIYLLRPFAISIDLVDRPNNRKSHKGSVPLIGGIAMYIGVVIGILVSSHDLNKFNFFLLASFIIIIVGILDDHHNISVTLRLLFQGLVAVIIASVGGIQIESLGNVLGIGEITLNEWSYFFTVIAIVAAMNAVNMADGIHGLAGGNSLITLLAILYLSISSISNLVILIMLLLCAALPVFLINNLCLGVSKSKRIFMGDAGSMFIGLVIVCILVDLSQGEDRVFSPVTALWLFAIPLIEMSTAILRRIVSGKSPFKPDSLHTHHLFLRFGIRENNTLLLMLFISLSTAAIGILGEIYDVAEWLMFVGFMLVFLIYISVHGIALKRIQENGK